MIQDVTVLRSSMIAYITLVSVALLYDEQPEQAKLQAVLEQQQASLGFSKFRFIMVGKQLVSIAWLTN